jgi:hypothetical protein
MNEDDSFHSNYKINHRKKLSVSRNEPECEPIDILYQMILSEKKIIKKSKITPSYLNIRINGVEKIKILCNDFELDEKIFHSSIYLMDFLYTQKEISDDILKISFSCFVLCLKFYENGTKTKQILEKIFNNEEDIKNYLYLEQKILFLIEYEMCFWTTYDILSFLLENGITFSYEKDFLLKNNINVNQLNLNCFFDLNKIVETKFYLNYRPIDLAFSIIFLIREKYVLDDLSLLFEEIYGIQLNKKCLEFLKKKIKCKNVIMKKNKYD